MTGSCRRARVTLGLDFGLKALSLSSLLFDSQAFRVAAFPTQVSSGKHGFTLDMNMVSVATIQASRDFWIFFNSLPNSLPAGKEQGIFVAANKALGR